MQELTTAAAIPYYTGRFGNSPRGFGFITIGANVEDFHRAATASAERIGAMTAESDTLMALQRDSLVSEIRSSLQRTAAGLSLSTALMTSSIWRQSRPGALRCDPNPSASANSCAA